MTSFYLSKPRNTYLGPLLRLPLASGVEEVWASRSRAYFFRPSCIRPLTCRSRTSGALGLGPSQHAGIGLDRLLHATSRSSDSAVTVVSPAKNSSGSIGNTTLAAQLGFLL